MNAQERDLGTPVLIVEDDAPLREIMQVLLESHPREIHFADSGAAAIAAVESLNPSIVLIDLGLPDMHGFDLARELRTRANGKRQPRLVAFTGFDSTDHREAAQAAGFDEFYTKPMDLDAMEATFTRILGDGATDGGSG